MAGHVDYEELAAHVERNRAMGIETPAMAYLWAKAPRQELDQWGEPLPLSPMQQDQLDRIFAVLAGPLERGTALLHSGQLIDDEVDAIMTVYPDVYLIMLERAQDDMFKNPPPYPAWAEAQLGVLFRKPASTVYAAPEKPIGEPSGGTLKAPEGTQADRRELSLREGR
jgi:hypothetical protein